MAKVKSNREILASAIKENPIYVQLLGMCPTLAVTSTVENSIGMGAGVIFVLVFSNLIISLIRNFVPSEVRIPIYIVIIASLVTILEFMMKAFVPSLAAALGVFLPLITVNCLILGRAESFAAKNTPGKSMLDGLAMGIGFTIGLVSIGLFREVLGAGTILGITVLPESYTIGIIGKSAGAFLVFGTLVALVTKLSERNKQVA